MAARTQQQGITKLGKGLSAGQVYQGMSCENLVFKNIIANNVGTSQILTITQNSQSLYLTTNLTTSKTGTEDIYYVDDLLKLQALTDAAADYGLQVGDLAWVESESAYYRWNGSSFVLYAPDTQFGTPGGSEYTIQFHTGSVGATPGAFSGSGNFTYNYLSQSLQQGNTVLALGQYSHAEGISSRALELGSHAEGLETNATNQYAHAEGTGTHATGVGSHAEGQFTSASGQNSHAEGGGSRATNQFSHAEGTLTLAQGTSSHSEGLYTTASGNYSHAEGQYTKALMLASHAEGSGTIASGNNSHAEGAGTEAAGNSAHAEGQYTLASGSWSHAEGRYTTSSGQYSHAEGENAIALSDYSHAEGNNTVASGSHQHVQGQWNISSSVPAAFIVGNGTSNSARSNLVFAAGSDFHITGSLRVTGSASVTGSLSARGDARITSGSLQVTGSFSNGSDADVPGFYNVNDINAGYQPHLRNINTGSNAGTAFFVDAGNGISGSRFYINPLNKGNTINTYYAGGASLILAPSSVGAPNGDATRPMKFLSAIVATSAASSFEWHYRSTFNLDATTLVMRLDVPSNTLSNSGRIITSASLGIASGSVNTANDCSLYFGNSGSNGSWRFNLLNGTMSLQVHNGSSYTTQQQWPPA